MKDNSDLLEDEFLSKVPGDNPAFRAFIFDFVIDSFDLDQDDITNFNLIIQPDKIVNREIMKMVFIK